VNGALGQFGKPDAAARAARRARGAGPWSVEAFAPFAVEELSEAVGAKREPLPAIVFAGGLTGCLGAILLQYWAQVLSYPINVGGRPLDSWPAWIPVCFELTVLIASFSALFGLIALNGLPRLNHPLFEVEAFKRASQDKFFVWLSPQQGYDGTRARELLKEAGAEEVYDVP
jgi:hypothetical protein